VCEPVVVFAPPPAVVVCDPPVVFAPPPDVVVCDPPPAVVCEPPPDVEWEGAECCAGAGFEPPPPPPPLFFWPQARPGNMSMSARAIHLTAVVLLGRLDFIEVSSLSEAYTDFTTKDVCCSKISIQLSIAAFDNPLSAHDPPGTEPYTSKRASLRHARERGSHNVPIRPPGKASLRRTAANSGKLYSRAWPHVNSKWQAGLPRPRHTPKT